MYHPGPRKTYSHCFKFKGQWETHKQFIVHLCHEFNTLVMLVGVKVIVSNSLGPCGRLEAGRVPAGSREGRVHASLGGPRGVVRAGTPGRLWPRQKGGASSG